MITFKDGVTTTGLYRPATYINSTITPVLIVIHDTAGRLTPKNSANYLRGVNDAKASVHFVVERDGAWEQQVPITRGANHAGRSSYNGRSGCNGFSLGIEIVNPGKMTLSRSGYAKTWYGQEFSIAEYGIQRIQTPEHGDGYWMPYTPEQVATVTMLCQSMVAAVPTIRDIRPHWYVSPGRKVDTNPFWRLDVLLSTVFNRIGVPEIKETVRVKGAKDGLNLRSNKNFTQNVIAVIPEGTVIPVLSRSGDWIETLYNNKRGWVVSRLTVKET